LRVTSRGLGDVYKRQERAGVGLRFVRELEQGKQTVQLDKVNQVLALFGGELGVVQKTES
jgi:hypothetical protein